MKILLVNPPRLGELHVIREDRCEITERGSLMPPYSLIQIAAILREGGHQVDVIDANGVDMGYQELEAEMGARGFDVLVFRFTPTTFDHDMETSRISKKVNKDALTIGLCWTLREQAERVLGMEGSLDVYVLGDYELIVKEIIDRNLSMEKVDGIAYRSGGEVLVNPVRKVELDYDSLPLPAYDLLPSLMTYYVNTRHGSPYTIIFSSKGCPYGCIYCTVAKTPWKSRSAESILQELRYLKEEHDIKTVSFFDETFTLERDRAVTICNAMVNEKMGIDWYCNTRVDRIDLPLLKLMKKAGCKGLSFGIESASQKILDRARKGINISDAREAISQAKEAGIKTLCSFMFGLPGEDWSTVRETIDFVKETLPNGAQFNVVVPYPGTELYRETVQAGLIDEDLDFAQLLQHASILPTEKMTTDELEKARKMAYSALYFNPKWIFENFKYLLREPADFSLAVRYDLKSLRNFLFYRMEHAH